MRKCSYTGIAMYVACFDVPTVKKNYLQECDIKPIVESFLQSITIIPTSRNNTIYDIAQENFGVFVKYMKKHYTKCEVNFI